MGKGEKEFNDFYQDQIDNHGLTNVKFCIRGGRLGTAAEILREINAMNKAPKVAVSFIDGQRPKVRHDAPFK